MRNPDVINTQRRSDLYASLFPREARDSPPLSLFFSHPVKLRGRYHVERIPFYAKYGRYEKRELHARVNH